MTTLAALASVGEDRVAVLHGFEPAWPAAHMLGPAFTAQGAPGDNLALKPAKNGAAELRVPVELGGVRIEPGDLVAGDADGIVVVPRAHADELLAAAAQLEAREREILAQIEEGRTTVEIYGYEPL